MAYQYIDREECIGDSLVKINTNTANLDSAVIDINTQLGTLYSNIANIRLSYSSTTPVPTTDILNATTLFIHPYRGNIISLYNTTTNTWIRYTYNDVLPFSIATLNANTNYDVYLSITNNVFAVNFVAWSSSVVGAIPPTRTYKDGVVVNPIDFSQRFVGCLRTTSAGRSEQSFGSVVAGGSSPKQFLWNAQNRVPTTVRNFDNGNWSVQSPAGGSTGWLRVNQTGPGGGFNNKLSFISGDQLTVDVSSTIHFQMNRADAAAYQLLSVNNDITPIYTGYGILGSENAGLPNSSTYSELKQTLTGYNYVQMFELYYTNGYVQAIGDAGHGNLQLTGFIASLES